MRTLRSVSLLKALCLSVLPLTGAALWEAGPAQAGTLYISAREGVAIGGYDPVSFFTGQQPLQGSEDHALMWKGAVWMFASAENRMRFEADPRAFAPRYGGHCAYGIAFGKVATGDPLRWQIVDGDLYLFGTERAEALWRRNPALMIKLANAQWPEVMRDD